MGLAGRESDQLSSFPGFFESSLGWEFEIFLGCESAIRW